MFMPSPNHVTNVMKLQLLCMIFILACTDGTQGMYLIKCSTHFSVSVDPYHTYLITGGWTNWCCIYLIKICFLGIFHLLIPWNQGGSYFLSSCLLHGHILSVQLSSFYLWITVKMYSIYIVCILKNTDCTIYFLFTTSAIESKGKYTLLLGCWLGLFFHLAISLFFQGFYTGKRGIHQTVRALFMRVLVFQRGGCWIPKELFMVYSQRASEAAALLIRRRDRNVGFT